jgi:hypothetical protein
MDGVKVKSRPLLFMPLTVTTTLPVTAPAGTVATSAPGFQLLTVAATPPKVTVLAPCDEPKFEPEMVTVAPTAPEFVLRAVITGAALMMGKVVPEDVPAVSDTDRVAVPTLVIRLAGTAAISCVELTNVVLREVLPHSTDAPDAKLVPFTVSAKPALPAITDAGEVLVMVGTPTENVELAGVLPEEDPSGFVTAMTTEPAVATRLAGTAACNCVELTKVVVKAVPLHSTVAPGTKFVPVTVKVKPVLPVGTELGEIPETDGAEAAVL